MKRLCLFILALVSFALTLWWTTQGSGMEKPSAESTSTASVKIAQSEFAAPARTPDSGAFAAAMSPENDPLGLRAILAITDPAKRNARLIEALRGLNAENVYAVIALLESTVPKTRESTPIYQALLSQWARFDGPAATQYTFHSMEGDMRLDCGVAALRSWAQVDLPQATEYLKNLPEDYGKDYMVYDFVFPSIDADPAAAMQWINELPDSLRGNAARHAANYWLLLDEQAATDWLVAHSNAPLERLAIREVALHWVRHDLKQADQLVTRLQRDEAKAVAMEAIVDWLTTERPAEVADWLNEFENTPLLDRVYSQFALRISRIDPGSAVSWAESIMDPEYRLATLSEIERRNTGATTASP